LVEGGGGGGGGGCATCSAQRGSWCVRVGVWVRVVCGVVWMRVSSVDMELCINAGSWILRSGSDQEHMFVSVHVSESY
jgi:hypothetical protein